MTALHKLFGYGGLIPLVVIGYLWLSSGDADVYSLLISYSALIYSFIGGIYWLCSLQNQKPSATNRQVTTIVSVTMMVFAWLWIIFASSIPLWLIAVSFAALPLFEQHYLNGCLSREFNQMRKWLSYSFAAGLLSFSVIGFLL